ncbi:MAG: nickel pincer cofactor biosynthesis protein LarC [bacterium]|nr:nickel pincer cofactor biosynthesis protein LarC [bacterium]
MKTLYFDCFAGASGDMLLGALLDLGLPLDALEAQLARLALPGYSLSSKKVIKQGVSATKFDVHVHEAHEHHTHGEGIPHHHAHGRSLSQIEALIRESGLSGPVKARSLRAFRRLGEVEAGIHGVPVEEIHFHEVGAVDSIVDITGFFIGLEFLGIERVLSSPLPLGRGFIECAHGRMPVPAPATAKLLEGVSVFDNGLEGEVLTPTGALLLTECAESFGPVPEMTIHRVGYGAGGMDQPVPNAVRGLLGTAPAISSPDAPPAALTIIEANLDDMAPELIPYVIEKALQAGAVDAFSIPVTGKKGRPGHLLTVLSPNGKREQLARLLFRETTTLGVRYHSAERSVAERDWFEVELEWGKVRIKRGRFEGETINLAPEYEDCRKLAEASGIPLKVILEAASAAARAAAGDRP